jgi:hypothetical protein
MRLASRQREMREREAWAAAGVGSVDICELKRLIKSQGFKDPIIGIELISENELQINVGPRAIEV